MCEPEDMEDMPLSCGNIDGPFWCPICGRTTCELECVPVPTGGVADMSLRDKSIKMPPTAEHKAWDAGKGATKWELEAYLTAYLGDDVFARRFADCIDLLRAKNADYSQNEQVGDRIAAFRRIARDVDLPMRKVWAVFAQKHWGAIMRFCKEGRVESEPIDGRINDLINYAVLFGPIVEEEKATQSEKGEMR